MKISCSNVSMISYTLVNFERETLYSALPRASDIILRSVCSCIPHIQSYTITVWYAFLSFFTHYFHKVMDEYRRCRHRSIKFQTLTGVMKPAFWQEQVFLLYHFSLPLQSSILSIIRNKKGTRENCCTLHPSYRFLWIFMTMLNNPYKYWNSWTLNFLHGIASKFGLLLLFILLDIYFKEIFKETQM